MAGVHERRISTSFDELLARKLAIVQLQFRMEFRGEVIKDAVWLADAGTPHDQTGEVLTPEKCGIQYQGILSCTAVWRFQRHSNRYAGPTVSR